MPMKEGEMMRIKPSMLDLSSLGEEAIRDAMGDCQLEKGTSGSQMRGNIL